MAQNKEKKVADFLNELFSSALVGAILPLLAIFAGFTLSYYKDEILDTLFRFAWPSDPHFSRISTVFWVLILLMGILYFSNTWAKNRDSARAKAEVKGNLDDMQHQTEKLRDAVTRLHSLPPVGVLEVCKQAYDLCEGYYSYGDGIDPAASSAKNELESTMRRILFLVEGVIRIFDGNHLDGSGVRYGLNVMIFVRRSEYKDSLWKMDVARRLKFAKESTSLDLIVGVLDIVPAISIATGQPNEDSDLVRFAIPIEVEPVLARTAQETQITLAGASDALINIIHTAVPSVEILRQKMEKTNIDGMIKNEVLDYFSQGNIPQTIQSFICIPLVAEGIGIMGVLNIHRNAPNPGIEDRMNLLVPLMTPFRHQLARLLLKYKQV